MNNIDFHINIWELIKKYVPIGFAIEYIDFNDNAELNTELSRLNIRTENSSAENRVRAFFQDAGIRIFKNESIFLSLKKIEADGNYLVLSNEAPLSLIDGKTYENFSETANNFFFTNAIYFRSFQTFLKSLEISTSTGIHFIDNYNEMPRRLTFVSLAENSRLVIEFKSNIPVFDKSKDYSLGFEDFKRCFSSNDENLPKFLKNVVISKISNIAETERLKVFFETLNEINKKAKLNLEIYLNNVSIDKLRQDYSELKSKYFLNTSTIVSKLNQHLLGLPLATSATLFAIFKLQEIKPYLAVLQLVLLASAVYLIFVVYDYLKDTIYTEDTFNRDYQYIEDHKFFKKNAEELKSFAQIKDYVSSKIKFLKNLIHFYYWALTISNIVIIGFILEKFNIEHNKIIFITVILLVSISIIWNIFFRKKKDFY